MTKHTQKTTTSALPLALTEKRAKQMADRLGAFLAAGGTTLGRRNLLEAVAAMLGGTDWNTWKAMIATAAEPEVVTLGIVVGNEGEVEGLLCDHPGLRIDALRLASENWFNETRNMPMVGEDRIPTAHCPTMRRRLADEATAAERRLPFNEKLAEAIEAILCAHTPPSEWNGETVVEYDGAEISIFHGTDDPASIKVTPFGGTGVDIVDHTRTEGFDGGRFRVEHRHKIIASDEDLPKAVQSLLYARFLGMLTDEERHTLETLETERRTFV